MIKFPSTKSNFKIPEFFWIPKFCLEVRANSNSFLKSIVL